MAFSTAALCLLLLGALCLANAATTTVQRDLVDATKFLYNSLSQAQVQHLVPSGITNASTADLVDAAKFLYDSLSQAQVQQNKSQLIDSC